MNHAMEPVDSMERGRLPRARRLFVAGRSGATFLSTADGGSTVADRPIIAGDSMEALSCSSNLDCTAVGTSDVPGVDNVAAGTHTLHFTPATGFVAPPDQTLAVTEHATIPSTGNREARKPPHTCQGIGANGCRAVHNVTEGDRRLTPILPPGNWASHRAAKDGRGMVEPCQ